MIGVLPPRGALKHAIDDDHKREVRTLVLHSSTTVSGQRARAFTSERRFVRDYFFLALALRISGSCGCGLLTVI